MQDNKNTVNGDFFNHLIERSNQLTKKGRVIFEYIKSNPEDILYYSITELASKIRVSETSVFRFCKAMGFEGYQEMKVKLARSLNDPGTVSDINVTKQVASSDTVVTIAAKLLNSNVTSLNQTAEILSHERLKKAVEVLKRAQTIGFFGIGSSGLTAMEAQRKFGHIRKNLIHTMDIHDQQMMATLMDEKDVAIIFSYSGATRDMIVIMEILKARGVILILVTRYAVSAATELADIVLLYGSSDGLFTGSSLTAKIAQLFLVDILYTAYYVSSFDEAKEIQTSSVKLLHPKRDM